MKLGNVPLISFSSVVATSSRNKTVSTANSSAWLNKRLKPNSTTKWSKKWSAQLHKTKCIVQLRPSLMRTRPRPKRCRTGRSGRITAALKNRRPKTSKWWSSTSNKKRSKSVRWILLTDRTTLGLRLKENSRRSPTSNSFMSMRSDAWKERNSNLSCASRTPVCLKNRPTINLKAPKPTLLLKPVFSNPKLVLRLARAQAKEILVLASGPD